MKAKSIFLLFLITGFLWVSCEKSDISHSRDFDKSYKKWLDFKAVTGDSYRYQVVTGSWVGYWHSIQETTMTIKKGEVVKREFKWIINPNSDLSYGIPEEAPEWTEKEGAREWTEKEGEIGIHGEESGAAAAITLDEIYAMARQLLIKRKDVITSFETKNNGMISSCGYRHERCADDCFVGVMISFIEALSENDNK